MHLPLAFALLYLQNHTSAAWRVVHSRVNKQKIWSHLIHDYGATVDMQSHFDQGGMAAVT